MSVTSSLIMLAAWVLSLITVRQVVKHRHKWGIKAVDHGVMSEPRRNATAILYVCSSCGEAKSMTLAGTFQLEQIRSSSPVVVCTNEKQDAESIPWSSADKMFAKSLKLKL